MSLTPLALYGLVVLLVSLPLIVLACVIRNRVQEDEALDEIMHEGAR